MTYQELFAAIQNPANTVVKHGIKMMGGVENIQYSLRDNKGKILFYVRGSELGMSAPAWIENVICVGGQKQHFSLEQIADVFNALSKKYDTAEQKPEIVLPNFIQNVK